MFLPFIASLFAPFGVLGDTLCLYLLLTMALARDDVSILRCESSAPWTLYGTLAMETDAEPLHAGQVPLVARNGAQLRGRQLHVAQSIEQGERMRVTHGSICGCDDGG